MDEIDAAPVAAIEAQPRVDFDAQPVQPGHGFKANVGLDIGGGAVMFDGEPHMGALGGELLGDARSHPVAHPVVDHDPRAGSGAAGQDVGGVAAAAVQASEDPVRATSIEG